jgi:acetyl esterase
MKPAVDQLTPAAQALMARVRRVERPSLHTLTPGQARAAYAMAAEVLEPARAPLARVEDVAVPVGAGLTRPARLYASEPGVLPVMLYLHGGGFTIGGLETHDSLCRQIALRSGVALLSLDYRLAPEHRFPAAVDDSWAALHWLAGEGATRLGLDGRRLAVGGDSAGGTLAAVAALHARDVRLPLALQALITPGTTAHADTPSHQRYARGFLLERDTIEWFFGLYIDAADRTDWRFAPLLAGHLDDVAPAWVGLAECDPLVDEGLDYADRLRLAGVRVELELYKGVTHDFIKHGRFLPEAAQAQASLAQALSRALLPTLISSHEGPPCA